MSYRDIANINNLKEMKVLDSVAKRVWINETFKKMDFSEAFYYACLDEMKCQRFHTKAKAMRQKIRYFYNEQK